MRFQKFKQDSFCLGARHRSATKNIYGDITSKCSKVLIGYCSTCKKKPMTVSDNTITAKGVGDFFKYLGKIGLNVTKNMAENILKDPGRALDITANIPTAAAARNPNAALSTLQEFITFYKTGKFSYLGKFVRFYTI